MAPGNSSPGWKRQPLWIRVLQRLVQLIKRPRVRLGVTVLLLAAVFYQVQWRQLGSVLAASDPGWLLAGLAFFVPQWLCSTWRWRRLVAPAVELTWREAWHHQCQAATWSLLLPGKTGEASKIAALYLAGVQARRAGGLLLWEKIGDLLALALLAALAWAWPDRMEPICLGLLLVGAGLVLGQRWLPKRSGPGDSVSLKQWPPQASSPPFRGALLAWAVGSLVLWQLHLGQILFFAWACGLSVDWADVCRVVPLALVVGLVPVSWWGLGTRDAVLVGFWVPPAQLEQLLLLAVLLALRYLVPGVVGLAWLGLSRPSCEPVAEPPWADSAAV